MNIPRLEAWVKRIPTDTCKLEMTFSPGDGVEEPVHTWVYNPADSNPHLIAQELLATAQDDCDQRDVPSRYALRGLDENGDKTSGFVLKQRPESRPNDPLQILDGGVNSLDQLRRVSEVQLRLQVSSMGQIIEGYNKIIKHLTEENEQLRKREARLSDILHQATEEALGQEGRNEALEKLTGIAEQVAPIVIHRWASSLDGKPGNIDNG